MFTVFLICAVAGGTILVLQFVMALIGFGTDSFDMVDDIPDAGDVADAQGDVHGHGSSWLFGVISLRTMTAALAFFGLVGIATIQANPDRPELAIIAGLLAGAVAMYGVHFLMRLFMRLQSDGTVNIRSAVGQRCSVYVPIPANRGGSGKVQVRVQGRLMEYAAMTPHDAVLPTGAQVEVTKVVSPTTLEVNVIETASPALPEDQAEPTSS